MGRPINSIRKANLRVKTNREGFKKLIALAGTVHVKMTGNTNFTTPVPTLLALQTAQTDLKNATVFMGLKRNRGSKAEGIACREKAIALRNLLTAMLKYVINTATLAAAGDVMDFNTILVSSGFAISDVRSINAKAQIATFVRQDNSKLHPGSEGRLNFKRPLGLIKGAKVAGYNIYIGGKIALTTTKTNAIIPTTPGVNTDVVIVPFNSRGSGAAFTATIKGL